MMAFNGGGSGVTSIDSKPYSLACLNHVRQLLDRAVTYSKDSKDLWGDAFIDSDGRNNSVNAGETTATFQTDKYRPVAIGADNSETHGSFGSAGSGTSSYGMKITTKNACVLKSVTKHASSGANRAQLFTSAYVLLATASFSGNTATFNYQLADDTTYIIEHNASGASIGVYNNSSPGLPQSKTDYNLIGGSIGGTDTALPYEVLSMVTNTLTAEEKLITLNIPTGTYASNVLKACFKCYVSEYESGVVISYKLTNASEDSGYFSDGVMGIFTAFTSEPTKLVIKLTPKTSGPTVGYPSIKGVAGGAWSD